MRWLVTAMLLTTVACRTRIQGEHESELYGGLGVIGGPNVGAVVTGGQYIAKASPKYDFAFELRGAIQSGEDSATQDGRFFQVQAGVKQVTSPGHPRRLTFRYGFTWFRANGDPDIIDDPGDYFGVYGGVGYEWDLTPKLSFGPDLTLNFVDGEGSRGSEFLPQIALNLFLNF